MQVQAAHAMMAQVGHAIQDQGARERIVLVLANSRWGNSGERGRSTGCQDDALYPHGLGGAGYEVPPLKVAGRGWRSGAKE